MFYSPLRYPGGKNKLAKFVALVCEKNNINGHYVEPYAGGAAVALHLLINGYVKEITINDLDRSIYAFWHNVLEDTNRFVTKINSTRVSIAEWERCKEIQRNKKSADLFDLGFSTFFLNRTNKSGILNGGPIGGMDQTGEYKINCRYNKKGLVQRIELIASFKKQIHLSKMDALELIKKIKKESSSSNVILYFDPPYYLPGETLYYNAYKPENHEKVAKEIRKIKNFRWLVSYEGNAPEIRKMYHGLKNKKYFLRHTARESKMGKEIIFFSPNSLVPRVADPIAV